MGLILDSSVLIGAERKGKNARQVVSEIASRAAGEDIAFSAVTLIEMAHGAARAATTEQRTRRWQFLQELMAAVPIHPVTAGIALRAGRIDGENAAKGIRLALPDLLIGVTALELGFRVATTNLRHFKMVPGLEVISF